MKRSSIIILICAFSSQMIQAQQKRKIIFSATFVEKNLKEVGLSEEQWKTFYKLTYKLTDDIVKLRKETGITKELIEKRDEVYKDMKKDPDIKPEEYMAEMGRRLGLTKKELRGFSDPELWKKQFNKDINNLLTQEQKEKYQAVKKAKKKKK
ncbi:hypothetical protein [Seonamhaeicola marinus]|uniref:Uncharacterized protein n=1 Tax=Seonamhaeicola marinus TaxID=1912246 RepID=A0A5D0HSP5_9FLAO|nr:hypothetical protein [Seonamhaeicola marinus]TYA74285.1 hypothetical protein FUA24_13220 [Seonamhaeicola marinus]